MQRKGGGPKGLPLFPTLILLVMLPVLLALGKWQLDRRVWKHALLERLGEAATLPATDLAGHAIPEDFLFRHVGINVECPPQKVDGHAARNLQERPGFGYTIRCRAMGDQTVTLVIGWGERVDGYLKAESAIPTSIYHAAGTVTSVEADSATLLLSNPIPPLEAVQPPDLHSVSDNHLLYAIQWFAFALILVIIYALYVQKWRQRMPLARKGQDG